MTSKSTSTQDITLRASIAVCEKHQSDSLSFCPTLETQLLKLTHQGAAPNVALASVDSV